jgi:hypothetical protein
MYLYYVSYMFYYATFDSYSDAEDYCCGRGIPIYAIRRRWEGKPSHPSGSVGKSPTLMSKSETHKKKKRGKEKCLTIM